MDVHPGLRDEGCVGGSHSLSAEPRKDNLQSQQQLVTRGGPPRRADGRIESAEEA